MRAAVSAILRAVSHGLDNPQIGVTPAVLQEVADWLDDRYVGGKSSDLLREEAERLRGQGARARVLADLKPGLYSVDQTGSPAAAAVVLPDGRLMVHQFHDGALYDVTDEYPDDLMSLKLLAAGDLTEMSE